MILLRLKGEKVIEALPMNIPYEPKEYEILVEELPPIELQENEIAYIYYQNGKIEYEREVRK